MPHVIIKMYAGQSAKQKQQIADAVTQTIMTTTGHGADAVSVSIEDVAPADWTEKVYKPDIIGKPGDLYKHPGYDPRR
jgi:4-oxalocrotonate tautomerase